MVPLPDGLEPAAVEIVAAGVGCVWFHCCADLRFQPSARRAAKVAGEAEVGPSVHPCHRRQAGGAAHGKEVKHRKAPPVAIFELYYSALVECGAAHVVGIRFAGFQAPFARFRHGAVHRDVCGPCGMFSAQGFTAADDAGLVGPFEAVGARTHHASHRGVVGADYIVFSIDLVGVVAFAHSVSGGDDAAVATIYIAAEIRLDLDAVDFVVAVDGVYAAVVKEY